MRFIERVMLLRRGGDVTRFHREGDSFRQSVAEHTFGVMLILEAILPESWEAWRRYRVLRAALYHDIAEQVTGDIPKPVSWEYPEVKAAFATMEKSVLTELQCNTDLTPGEAVYLHAADFLEIAFFTTELYLQGNRRAALVWKKLEGSQAVQDHFAGIPKALELYEELQSFWDEVRTHQDRILLSFSQLSLR